ncbi:MAG TPA: lysophospholipid acyltransferase family protein [Acidimicrobiales bacterium]|nr:lysophospholipid acyltransferase family protein [Acidimicrobiales bacterium]
MPVVTEHGENQIKVGHLFNVAKALLGPMLRFGWKVRVESLENVPAQGPAILCPNHTSFIDSVFLPLVLPRRITYVGKAEYMDDWKTKHLFPAIGMIPLDRAGGSASERALNAAIRVLERGELFGIFPEGTRSRDGVLHKGHTGPARLALRTGAPLVPVGLRGMRDIQPPEAKFPKPFKACSIHFGSPISVDRYRDRVDDHFTLRQLTDEVMFEIRNLSGQQYVDTYATKKAEDLPTEVARVPAANGHDDGDAHRRSSADVLNPQGAVPVAH